MIPYSVGESIGLKLDMSTRSEIQGIGEGSVPYVIGQIKFGIEDPICIGWALIVDEKLIANNMGYKK